MILHGKLSTGKYIVYSLYEIHTHVTLNAQGLVQTCNPRKFTVNTEGGDKYMVIVYDSLAEAEADRDEAYNRIAEVQEIMEISNHQSFRTLDEQLECKLKIVSQ